MLEWTRTVLREIKDHKYPFRYFLLPVNVPKSNGFAAYI